MLIMPWKLIADPTGYIFTWLIAYSSLLGPIGGIMIADYYFVKRQELVVHELYSPAGRYWFSRGFNLSAIWAMLIGIAPNVPGFLVTVKIIPTEWVWPWVTGLYHYAWFVGFIVSGLVYLALQPRTEIAPTTQPA